MTGSGGMEGVGGGKKQGRDGISFQAIIIYNKKSELYAHCRLYLRMQRHQLIICNTVVWEAVNEGTALTWNLSTFYTFPEWTQEVNSINKDFIQMAWSPKTRLCVVCLHTQMWEWVQRLTHAEGPLSHSSRTFLHFQLARRVTTSCLTAPLLPH